MDNQLLNAISTLLDEKLEPIKTEIVGIKEEMVGIKSQLDENTQILKALEHKVDVIKAEQENMKMDIAFVKGEVKEMKSDMLKIEKTTADNWSDIVKLKSIRCI